MPTLPDSYYNNFDASKNYESLLYRDGYTLQGAELNEQQSAAAQRLRGIADALFKDGDIIRDASLIVDKTTGLVRAASGAVYLNGAVRGVPDAEFTIPVEGSIAVGVRLKEKMISELDDASLYNPAIGSRGEGEPGAWRLQVAASWAWENDNGEGEFYPVYAIDNGELRAKEAPPTLDSFTQGIARYDRDSTAGGSYIVNGLTVLDAGDAVVDGEESKMDSLSSPRRRGLRGNDEEKSGNDGERNGNDQTVKTLQVFTVSEGRARVDGYGVELPTSRRLTRAAEPDLRLLETEVIIADASSTQPSGQRITVAHAPIHDVTALRITTRKTATVTHGNYTGCSDDLPDTAIVTLVECRQGDKVFAAGTDYKKTGDRVDWTPSGAEPASGSTYSVTYDCIVSVEPQNLDPDGFTVTGAVTGSSILISYRQALPRLDRLCLNGEGLFVWLTGVASESNPAAPAVPSGLLPLATVFQTWRTPGTPGGRSVTSDGVRVVPFSEIETINRRIDYVLQEVARQRLESDVATREAGARVGLFVDPLLNDDMRDQGLAQTAAVVNGVLTLPITANVSGLSKDVTSPAGAAYTPKVFLEQPFRTGSMRVNPYDAFAPLPARLTLTPALDRWTEYRTQWASGVTEKFDTGHIVWGVSWVGEQHTSSRTDNLGSSTSRLEYLRQIDIAYRVEGFGAGEQLASASFDGIPLNLSGTANAEGVLTGSFKVPANIPAGSKTVTFTGKGGSTGSAVFTGQGNLTVTTLRQVNTITTVWYDPLAQTFSPGKACQICGCELWFTAVGSDPRVQIREVQNGVPGRAILAEARLRKPDVKLDGPTRVLFDNPLAVSADAEYALVVLCDDAQTSVAVAELGKFDSSRQTWITSQPYQVGVLLSSSNASTWTAHQDRDLTFRLLEADFTPGTATVDLGTAAVTNATDLLLLALAETPTAKTRAEYALALPGGTSLTVAAGQAIRLPAPVSGNVGVTAKLAADAGDSPLLWPGTQLVSGTVTATGDYYTRSIVATNATRAVLVYDALIPAGAAVKAEIRLDGGAWSALAADGTIQQGDGVVEYRWKQVLSGVNEIKVKLTLTGNSAARPQVANIRFMAVI